MVKDDIVDEVRKVRKEIENENNNNWTTIGSFLIKKQRKHKANLYKGHPKKLVKSKVA